MCYLSALCETNNNKTCVLPYKYNSKTQYTCYNGWHGYWCPYEVNADLTYKEWDYCVKDNCSEEGG